MNFLAHFWLADEAGADLAGALLGDYWRGALPADMPGALAHSVRLHRRIDAVTDAHPAVTAARGRFASGSRRYAGILLDILYDHCLAQDWPRYSAEPLPGFARRGARAVTSQTQWFENAGGPVPRPEALSALLLSYVEPAGIDRAIHRTALRLRQPQGLLDASYAWADRLPQLRSELPELLADLGKAADAFMRP